MIAILVMTDWSPYLQGFRGLRCVSDGGGEGTDFEDNTFFLEFKRVVNCAVGFLLLYLQ